MRYINSFLNESTHYRRSRRSKSMEIESVENFCELSLVYLLDEGFKFTVYYAGIGDREYSDRYRYYINFGFPDYSDLFKWNDIKDVFISFVERLSKKFIIVDNNISLDIFFTEKNGRLKYASNRLRTSVDNVLQDNLAKGYTKLSLTQSGVTFNRSTIMEALNNIKIITIEVIV